MYIFTVVTPVVLMRRTCKEWKETMSGKKGIETWLIKMGLWFIYIYICHLGNSLFCAICLYDKKIFFLIIFMNIVENRSW